MLSKTELKENLSKSIAKVVFNKIDGTEREMTCTLMENYIPEKTVSIPHVPRRDNENVLAVWDCDKQAWRSFRLDSIINIEYIGVGSV